MYSIEELKKYHNQILNMDCIDFMKNVPDKYFDLCCCDPPYGIGDKFKGGKNSALSKFNNIVEKGWDEKPNQEYFDEIFRISRNQIIWGGNYFLLKPSRCFVVWDKCIPDDFSMAMCEYAWTSFDKNAKIYKMPTEKQFREHPTQKPLKLFERLLQNYSEEGQLVLDCFSGSGTTAIACHNLNRNFICIEKDKDYYNASVERLNNAKAQLKLF